MFKLTSALVLESDQNWWEVPAAIVLLPFMLVTVLFAIAMIGLSDVLKALLKNH